MGIIVIDGFGVGAMPDANDACYPKENLDIGSPLDNSTEWII
ncbi:hypothetical protein [Lactobacillus panisapium]|nr:hypothetical protein [Lactobacillus panisapium]